MLSLDTSSLNLPDAAKQALASLESASNSAINAFSRESPAIALAAKRTGEICYGAIKDVIAGKMDSIGAERIARRSSEQAIDYAKASANLAGSVILNALKEFGLTLVKLIPGILGLA